MKTKSISSTSSAVPLRSSGSVSSVSGTGGADFASVLAGQMGEAEAASEASVPVAVNSVVGVIPSQNVGNQDEERSKRKRTVKYGEDLLGRLEEIRVGLIKGIIPKEKLYQLSQKLRQRNVDEINTDERLKEIIEEIEMRVEIEIAKLSRYSV